MSDKTYENFDKTKTTYHSDGSKSRTFDNLDGTKTTYHSDGSKSKTYKNLDDSYTSVDSNGERKHTYEKADGSYVTYDSKGDTAHTYQNCDGNYTTQHTKSGNFRGQSHPYSRNDAEGCFGLVIAGITFAFCTILGFSCAGAIAIPLAIVWIAIGFACFKLKKSINSAVLTGWAEMISMICYVILNTYYWKNMHGASAIFGLFGLYFVIPIGLGIIYVKLCETDNENDNKKAARYILYPVLNYYCVFVYSALKYSAKWMIIIALVIIFGVNVVRTLGAKKKNTLFAGGDLNSEEIFDKISTLGSKVGDVFSKTKSRADFLIKKGKTAINTITKKAEENKSLKTGNKINKAATIADTELSVTEPPVPLRNPRKLEGSSKNGDITFSCEESLNSGICYICKTENENLFYLKLKAKGKEKQYTVCASCARKSINKIKSEK